MSGTAILIVAGCSTAENPEDEESEENDETDTRSESADDDTASDQADDDSLAAFRATLESAGFEQVTLEPVDDGAVLELGYDATGTTEADVASEIELVTDGYTTTIEDGLVSTRLEAAAYRPDDGTVLDYFTVEASWVEDYLSGGLEWRELLTRVAETFVSLASEGDGAEADSNGEEDGGADGDGDEDGGADGNSEDDEGDADGRSENGASETDSDDDESGGEADGGDEDGS
ncbi:hypothetical protein C482_19876 [Natrialba chahannaoensis JCM 10990]|uniref:DUF8159 domain-containing protein n=1 Tax=Natrialba chahannaoensis JCM 10990 TaxID=1227492 RepID=M0A7E7_9EURY|nr:hypothetical protein C482_19876 [Natrialba chahannaoensis JCM 10990]